MLPWETHDHPPTRKQHDFMKIPRYGLMLDAGDAMKIKSIHLLIGLISISRLTHFTYHMAGLSWTEPRASRPI